MGGTYTLVVSLAEPATIEVGALGERRFSKGWYAYTGSAFGPGGFSRVDRHRDLARGEREVRHWHVDYLLGHPDTTIETVVRTPDRDVECAVARALPGAPASAPPTATASPIWPAPRRRRRSSRRSNAHTDDSPTRSTIRAVNRESGEESPRRLGTVEGCPGSVRWSKGGDQRHSSSSTNVDGSALIQAVYR